MRLSELCQGFHQLSTKRLLGFPLPPTWPILQGLFINSPIGHSRPHTVLKLGFKHKTDPAALRECTVPEDCGETKINIRSLSLRTVFSFCFLWMKNMDTTLNTAWVGFH